jgi:hypothetical protein
MSSLIRVSFAAALLVLAVAPASMVFAAEVFWGLSTDQKLVRFSDTAPGTPIAVLPIGGLPAGERMLAIEVLPDGMFIGISSTGRVYTLDRSTGTATPLAAQTGRLVVPVGTAFDFGNGELTSDAGQRIRIHTTADWSEYLLPPYTQAGMRLVATGGEQLHVFGVNDRWEVVVDAATDQVYAVDRRASPPTLLLVGSLGVDTSDAAGLANAVHVPDHFTPEPLYAALTVDGVPGLYLLDAAGHAALVGAIGSAPITSLTTDRQVLQVTGPPPAVGPIASFLEANTTLTITLRRTGDDTIPVDYDVRLRGVTLGEDVITPPALVHFAAGERDKSVTVSLLDDAVREGTEMVMVEISESISSATKSGGLYTFYIVDDDNQQPVLTLTSPQSSPVTVLTDTISISGTLTDDRPGVATVWLCPERCHEGNFRATSSNPFTFADQPLQMGVNRFRLSTRDSEGAESELNFVVVRGMEQSFIFAEGATGTFFDTDLLFANPHAVDVPVSIDFLREDGTVVPYALTLPARRRVSVNVDTIPGLEATTAATVVRTSSAPIVVERTMRWGEGGYGAATEKASPGMSTRWYFAEGSQGWFATFLQLVNPQDTSNDVVVRFLLESGPVVTKTLTIAPRSRATIDAGSIPDLVHQSFGMEVTFAQPGVAERAMYFGTSPLWTGGHGSAGATAAATDWFLAEGATGQFFETFVLVANPSSNSVDVTFTFLTDGGAVITRTKQVPANGRLTVNLELEDPALANAAVATRVTATAPVVVERSQYWPSTPDQWYEAHNTFGQTAIGRRWGLSEGRVGGPEGYQTYILLANPDPQRSAFVTLSILMEDTEPVLKMFVVPPSSRFNVDVSTTTMQVPEIVEGVFGVEIVSTIPIMVERSMYANSNGQLWSVGTNATGTRLPDADLIVYPWSSP